MRYCGSGTYLLKAEISFFLYVSLKRRNVSISSSEFVPHGEHSAFLHIEYSRINVNTERRVFAALVQCYPKSECTANLNNNLNFFILLVEVALFCRAERQANGQT